METKVLIVIVGKRLRVEIDTFTTLADIFFNYLASMEPIEETLLFKLKLLHLQIYPFHL